MSSNLFSSGHSYETAVGSLHRYEFLRLKLSKRSSDLQNSSLFGMIILPSLTHLNEGKELAL